MYLTEDYHTYSNYSVLIPGFKISIYTCIEFSANSIISFCFFTGPVHLQDMSLEFSEYSLGL